eukprot:m51a1_g6937 putative beta-ketoacyl synthase (4857) ;mRNA; f:212997-229652
MADNTSAAAATFSLEGLERRDGGSGPVHNSVQAQPAVATVVDAFKYRVRAMPGQRVYTWLDDGETDGDSVTVEQLWRRARAIGAMMQARGLRGRNVVLLYSFEGLDFICAFWACLISGVVAVPTYPPDPTRLHRSLGRFELILQDCDCALVITTKEIMEQMEEVLQMFPALRRFSLAATDDLPPELADQWAEPQLTASSVAFLQYTSGSTGLPKGVMVTHGCLIANERAIMESFRVPDCTPVTCWLPLYHDMGLIGLVVYGVFGGVDEFMMSPISFIKKPFRWLKVISDRRCRVTGGPNFAYELCARKVSKEQLATLDLSCLDLMFSGAEPVRAQTVEAFLHKFRSTGLKRTSFMPVYGLAEATLLVAGTRRGSAPQVTWFRTEELQHGVIEPSLAGGAESRPFVSCGVCSAGEDWPIRIVDAATRVPVPAGHVGEIWVSGPSVAAGYWNKPELSEATFRARLAGESDDGRTYLRTGDLGFWYEGNLYITGREKDLIIIHGKNHYPQDIESTVEKHPLVRPGCIAAFAVDVKNEEQLVVLTEGAPTLDASRAQQVLTEIRDSIMEAHELQPYAIVLLKHNTICKTSSGKIQRRACKELYVRGVLESLATWSVDEQPTSPVLKTPKPEALPAPRPSAVAAAREQGMSDRAQQIADRIVGSIAAKMSAEQQQKTEIRLNTPFSALGMTSADVIGLAGELEEWLGKKLSPTVLYEYPTIELLSRYLADDPSLSPSAFVAESDHKEPMAIVGLACRFPGAPGKEAFWRLMTEGRDAVSEVPSSRFDIDEFYDPTPRTPGKTYTRSGGFVDDVDLFDTRFFNVTRSEADAMDPQQRLLLMVTQEALDDAGEAHAALAGSRTAVVVGLCSGDYASMQHQDPSISSAFVATGGAHSIAANRISYFYDLQGPSICLDTACSSSLVALDVAMRYLQQGRCDRAIVGAANLILTPQSFIALSQASFLSPDGRCKAFDHRADGFARAEGVAAVVIKPLSAARAAGDRVYAVVLGSAVNQDGQSNGLTAPNPRAQQSLIRDAVARAGVAPESVQYIECHGTGTALGDPIEVGAIDAALCAGHQRQSPLLLGSVKTNIAHTEAAAGLAGLIKLSLALHRGVIPPSIHYERPNPKIAAIASGAVRVVAGSAAEWPAQADGSQRHVGGVSSFGFGGTNAHVVLGSADDARPSGAAAAQEERMWALAVSADTEQGLRATVQRYRQMLGSASVSMAALCHSALRRRTPRAHRAAFLGLRREEMAAAIDAWLAGDSSDPRMKKRATAGQALRGPNKLMFVFAGQGPQWYAMGRELYLTVGWFRDRCEEFTAIFGRLGLDWDIREEMSKMSAADSHMDQTRVAQVLLFTFQVCLARLWVHWGARPTAVMGHSLGEISAACFAGVLDDETACQLIFHRAHLMQEAHGKGKMCAVHIDAAEADELAKPYAETLSVACYNAPGVCVLSGDEPSLEKCLADARAKHPNLVVQWLPVNYVFHSPQLDPLVPQLAEKLQFLRPAEAKMKVYSTVTGEPILGADMDAQYWSLQMRRPVRLAATLAAAVRDDYASFVEISPHPVLSFYTRAVLDAANVDGVVVPSLVRKEHERLTMAGSLLSLWTCGAPVDPVRYLFDDPAAAPASGAAELFAELPPRVWDLQRYWLANPPRYGASALVSSAPLDETLYEEQWREAPLASAAAPEQLSGARLLVFSDGSAAAAALVAAAAPSSVAVALPESADAVAAAVAAALEANPASGFAGIVYCWASGAEGADAVRTVYAPAVLMQTLVRSGTFRAPVVFVTCNAVATPANAGKSVAATQRMAWGFAMTAAQEYPGLAPTVVDVSGDDGDAAALVAEVSAAIVGAGNAAAQEQAVALHGGKRLVRRAARLAAPPVSTWSDEARIDPEGVYLVTGGFGGLALELSAWLASRGCKHLVLVTRAAEPPESNAEARAKLAALREAVGDVRVEVANVADREAMRAVIEPLANLKGVFHLAGVLVRATIGQLTLDEAERSVGPKARAALHLHELTRGTNLDHFVLASSVSAWAPREGQAAYSASNAFLNALAEQRRREGLPALAFCIGLMGDVGMLARQDPRALEYVKKSGLYPTPASDVVKALAHFAAQSPREAVLVGRVDWDAYAPDAPAFALVRSSRRGGRPSGDGDAEPEAAERVVRSEEEIREWLGKNFGDAMHVDPRELDPEAPLSNYGLQSVVVTEITGQLSRWLGHKVSPNVVYDFPTLSALTRHLAGVASSSGVPRALAAAPAVSASEPIAIVGMACRFPGGCNDLEAYWRLLYDGVDAVREVPPERYRAGDFYDRDALRAGKMNSKWGGFVDDIDKFDADFWSISPREAERLDPQQRMCLETAWEALEDAGQVPSRLAGGRNGVFVGLSVSDYGQLMLLDDNVADAYFSTGTFMCMNANRLSYLLDFQGPSVSLDTACSSASVSVHLACNAIRNGECGLALAGGVNAILTPTGALTLTKTHALSPDGHCFAFDARANGFVRSEGCGLVVLKPLSRALADGDRVYATIAGSAVNQDGRSQGLTAPNGLAQQALLEDAYSRAGRSLAEVSYIECHGTGTALGDHIEVESLGQALLRHRPAGDKVLLASVKTNLGHLECASGAASLIKVALALAHDYVPRSLLFETPNPHIDFGSLPVEVSRGTAWPQGKPKLAGLSSFGFGGTNAHIVVQAAPQESTADPLLAERAAEEGPFVYAVSGRCPAAAAEGARRLADYVEAQRLVPLKDVAYTNLCRREHHACRIAVAVRGTDRAAVATALRRAAEVELPARQPGAPRVAFVFSGQGAQHAGMARQLYRDNAAFRAALGEVDALFAAQQPPFSVLDEISAPEAESRVGETVVAQRVLFAIQYALARALAAVGVAPRAVVGHSLGEIAAVVVAGVLPLAEAVRLVHVRSQVMNKATGLGRMLAVGLPAADCQRLADAHGAGGVALAASNSAASCVLSGEAAALEAVAAAVAAERPSAFVKFLPVNYAFHSPQMEPLALELRGLLDQAPVKARASSGSGGVAVFSTLTGARASGAEFTSEYWQEQVRRPVLFREALDRMCAEAGVDVFVELAPHPVLATYLRDALTAHGLPLANSVVAAMRRDSKDEQATLAQALAALHCRHVAVDWRASLAGDVRYARTPSYAWQKRRYWLPARPAEPVLLRGLSRADGDAGEEAGQGAEAAARAWPLLQRRVARVGGGAVAAAWEATIAKPGPLEWEFDHVGFGTVLVPGVTYLEAALEASAASFGDASPHVLSDIRFHRPLFMTGAEQRLQTSIVHASAYDSTVTLQSPGEREWAVHATVCVHRAREQWAAARPAPAGVAAMLARCPDVMEGAAYYDELWQRGLQLGPAFRSIERVHIGAREVVAELAVPAHLDVAAFVFHPSVLDATMQCLGAILMRGGEEIRGIFLPSRMERLVCHARPTPRLLVHIRMHEVSARAIVGDVRALSPDGEALLEIQQFRCNYVEDSRGSSDAYFEQSWRQLDARPASASASLPPSAPLFVFCDDAGALGARVVEAFRARGQQSVCAVARGEAFAVAGDGASATTAADDMAQVAALIAGHQRPRVVYAWAADARDSRTARELAVMPLARLVAALAAASASGAQVFVATAGARAVCAADSDVAVWQSPLLGAANIASQEYAQFRFHLVDLSFAPSEQEFAALAQWVCGGAAAGEDHVALRGGAVYTSRLVQAAEPATSTTVRTTLAETPARMEIVKPGVLDTLALRATPRVAPADEVEVRVLASSLNYRDVMRAMGLYPAEDEHPGVGMECVGVVERVGHGVAGLAPGDKVIAVSRGSFGAYVTTPAYCCVRRPECVSDEEAAALTGVLMTAYESLVNVARVQAGDKVLVHAASGGVGLAALQICRVFGCEVFATVGRKEKRDFLTQHYGIPDDHIFSSRNLSFVDEIRRVTRGYGVDVVLNSLMGEGLLQSFELLAHGGRFVEIGKRDIFENTRVGLRPFSRNVTLASVAIDQIFDESPTHARRLLCDCVDRIADGTFRPIPLRAFGLGEAVQAFRLMASAAHIGKIVVTVDHALPVDVVVPAGEAALPADGTYVVTGGLGALGLLLADFLLKRGVRSVALLVRRASSSSSSSSSPARAAAEASLRARARETGAAVTVLEGDVSSLEDVRRALGEVAARGLPALRGVFHAAGVVDDAMLAQVTPQSLARTFAPKADGAWNLHAACEALGADLAQFVVFSSVASLVGSPGQAAYAAANAFADALCAMRRARGQRALSVNWGPVAAGMTARLEAAAVRAMEAQGLSVLSRGQFVQLLSSLVLTPAQLPSQLAVLKIDWQRWAAANGSVQTKRFSTLAQSSGARTVAGRQFLQELFAMAPGEQRMAAVTRQIVRNVARVLAFESEAMVDVHRPLNELGLDSMVANEVRSKLENDMGIPISIASLIGGPSITKLATILMQQIEAVAGDVAGEADQAGAAPAVPLSLPVTVVGDDEGEAPTVFAFCPAGGSASVFNHLATRLGKRFVALQKGASCGSFGELVDAHVAAIVAACPRGPYTILGHSLGSAVGFETARALVARGSVVSNVIMLDPISPETQKVASQRTMLMAMMLMALGRGQHADQLQPLEDAAAAPGASEDGLWELFFALAQVPASERGAVEAVVRGMHEEMTLFAKHTFAAEHAAFPVSVLVATENDARLRGLLQTDRSAPAWSRLTGAAVREVPAPGNHWTMVSDPANAATNAATIAGILNATVAATEAPAATATATPAQPVAAEPAAPVAVVPSAPSATTPVPAATAVATTPAAAEEPRAPSESKAEAEEEQESGAQSEARAAFEAAVAQSKKLKKKPGNSDLLALYGLFKQSTEGDNTQAKPDMFDLVASSKWKSWTANKGKARDEAMTQYVALVEKLKAKYGY